MANYNLNPEPLLVFAWQHGLYEKTDSCTRDGEPVVIVDPGRRNPGKGPQFLDAQIRVGNKTCVGNVAVHPKSSDWGYRKCNSEPSYDSVILHVVGEDDRIVRKINDSIVPSLRISLPEKLFRAYESLLNGASKSVCGSYVKRNLTEIEFKNAYTRLMIDRLERKFNDIQTIYEAVDKNWHETFHVLFFGAMAHGKNKQIYMSLAQNVPYSSLCRERGDLQNIEAMLFGVAGQLDPSYCDDYKADLSKRFEMLRHRHQLRVMSYCEWSNKGTRPYSFASKRIAQLAAILNNGDFTFNTVLGCESIEDIRRLFRRELSEYWKRSVKFNTHTEKESNIGEVTIDILVINLIAPFLFAYGRMEEQEEFEERALDFIYATKAEINKYTADWFNCGIKPEHAMVSQALIQLSREYCDPQRCTECFLGTRLLKRV